MKSKFLYLFLISGLLSGYHCSAYCAKQENTPAAPEENGLQSIIDEGFTALFMAGDRQAALEKFNQALAIDPNSSGANVGLGAVYFEQGDIVLAKEYFVKAVTCDFRDASAFDGLGNCYRKLGDHKKAEDYYKHAIFLDDQQPWFHFHLGQLYSEGRNKKAAQAQARILAALDRALADKLISQIQAENP